MAKQMTTDEERSKWTFLTNHAHVLLCVAADENIRVRDLAADVGITERAVQSILQELESDGYITRVRDGRRTRYAVDTKRPLRHRVEGHNKVSELLRLVRR